MKPKLHKHLVTAILSVAFLGSSAGLPIVTAACPVMQKCPMGFSCCQGETNQQDTNPSPSTSYTCCSRTVLASSLRFESAELRSTKFLQKERAGLSNPSEAVLSITLVQDPSLIAPLIAGFSPPGNSYQLTLPLRI